MAAKRKVAAKVPDLAVKIEPADPRSRNLFRGAFAFTPLVLLGIATSILLFRAAGVIGELPSASTRNPSPVLSSGTGYKIPGPQIPDDLKQFTNADLRALSYELNSHTTAFLDAYISQLVKIQHEQASPAETAEKTRILDEQTNREFRLKFAPVLMKVESELVSRIADKKVRTEEMRSGILSSGDMRTMGWRLVRLANDLP